MKSTTVVNLKCGKPSCVSKLQLELVTSHGKPPPVTLEIAIENAVVRLGWLRVVYDDGRDTWTCWGCLP